MKQNNNENAANRTSYIGHVYNSVEKNFKINILNSIKKEWSALHKDGYIHIHDLDAYGLTYNCLTFNVANNFPINEFKSYNEERKIHRVFNFIIELFTRVGNEQSGGMAFANFDNELAKIFNELKIKYNKKNRNLIKNHISELILWCNNDHSRMGQTSYYVTFNIGLANNEFARFIAFTLIDEFESLGDLVFKPNIVFKVKEGINKDRTDQNYYLFKKSLLCTAKKMIPTYLLCDSIPNKDIDPNLLSIMGCRTRVVDDIYGKTGAIGRGNIANISINLPKLALEIDKFYKDDDIDKKMEAFKEKWRQVASTTKDILLDRFKKLCLLTKDDFPTNKEYQLWCEDFNKVDSLDKIFRHGTLSIGFIGLSESFEILTGSKYYKNAENYVIALGFVKYMRDYCDFLKETYKLNYSLLATSGELISGRFVELDKKVFSPKVDIFKKGFYTNSFHIDVDSGLSAHKKIKYEGLFHEICNGGCITYVELGEAPLNNDEGIREYLEIAIKAGINYIGFNFPKDVCNECGTYGVFDLCPKCKSINISRIRRVSGYLEILDGFTNGKKNEEKIRKSNVGRDDL